MLAKQQAASKAAGYIKDEMIIGLGTGSTAYWAIQIIGERVKEGLKVKAVATSQQTETLAREAGIPIVDFDTIDHIDITIDGADEVDEQLNLIKGGGGALLREKIIAAASDRFIVIVDESKLVGRLGKFPLPVEVTFFGWQVTIKHLKALGCQPALRQQENKIFITDNGNYIIDCSFHIILQPAALEKEINLVPGVVENGLFVNRAERVIAGYQDGHVEELVK